MSSLKSKIGKSLDAMLDASLVGLDDQAEFPGFNICIVPSLNKNEPDRVASVSWKIDSPMGKLFRTLGRHEDQLKNVYRTMGNTSPDTNAN